MQIKKAKLYNWDSEDYFFNLQYKKYIEKT